MKIKNILLKNNMKNVEKISDKILNISIDGDVEVERTNYLYKGYNLFFKNIQIGINLEDNSEFVPFVIFKFDENLNLVYENKLWSGKKSH